MKKARLSARTGRYKGLHWAQQGGQGMAPGSQATVQARSPDPRHGGGTQHDTHLGHQSHRDPLQQGQREFWNPCWHLSGPCRHPPAALRAKADVHGARLCNTSHTHHPF